MATFSTGTVTIPTALANAMKAEALILLNALVDSGDLDVSKPYVPSLTPGSWTNKQLYHYFAWAGPSLTSLMKNDRGKNDSSVTGAQTTAAVDVVTFDAARTVHQASSKAVGDARDAARDKVDADVISGVTIS